MTTKYYVFAQFLVYAKKLTRKKKTIKD